MSIFTCILYIANTINDSIPMQTLVKDQLKAELQSRQMQVHDLEKQLQQLQQLLEEVLCMAYMQL